MKNISETILFRHYMTETHFCIESGEFENGIMFAKNIEKKLEGITADNRFYKLLNFNLAYLYFGKGDYRTALKWATHFMNQPSTHIYEDLQAWMRIMIMLIHYELNHMDVIPYQIISAYRFLLKRKKMFRVEQSILNFIRNLSKIEYSQKTLINEFVKFLDELKQIKKDPQEGNAITFYFDIISWLESKIQNRSFAEIVKEKQKNSSRQTDPDVRFAQSG